MKEEIQTYNNSLDPQDQEICDLLANKIIEFLTEAEYKIWHRHPVWFLDGNPVTGYSKQKKGVRLMFWSGMSFDEELLKPGTGKFKDASIFYNSIGEVNEKDLERWVNKAKEIQWDYKNLIKRKGKLERL